MKQTLKKVCMGSQAAADLNFLLRLSEKGPLVDRSATSASIVKSSVALALVQCGREREKETDRQRIQREGDFT